jgi:hypothetical protein
MGQANNQAKTLRYSADHYSVDNGKVDSCCLSASEECWPTRDLLIILDRYHSELYTMFTGLVKWSVDSYIGQITAFTARDSYR